MEGFTMTMAIAYWVLMLVWLVFGFWSNWPIQGHAGIGGTLLLFVLLALVGWKVFGPPIHS